MKILQIIPALGTGGAEHCVVELTNELIRQGYDCEVLTLYDVAPDNELRKQLNPKANVQSLHKRPGIDIKCFGNINRYIKNGGFDVVHVHVRAIPYILLATLKMKKVRFVATIHSEAKREADKGLSKWSRFYMFKHRKCTPVTISEESRASFEKYYGMKAPMVYNGVSSYLRQDSICLHDNQDQIVFVHPARCQEVKNQQLLFKAFSKLECDYPNVKLLWLGNTKSTPGLYETLQPIISANVQSVGVVPNVRDYLAEADAMCLSSKMEGMPMTIIEAFSVGCPPLCTPVGGIVNMIKDGENGMLSEDLEVDSYYKMLKTFCELSVEKRQELSRNAQRSFEKFTVENSAKEYLKVYKS